MSAPPELGTAEGITLSPAQTTTAQNVVLIFRGQCTPSILDSFSESCIFEDPFAHAVGRREWSAQFYGLAKLFEVETSNEVVVLAEEGKIAIDCDIEYKMKAMKKVVNWKTTGQLYVETDAEGKVVRLEDRWERDGVLLKEKFWGVRNFFRRQNARMFPIFISIPKPTDERKNR
ncbi:hypothetical protein BT69DRAFT_1286948 [Atractiella rhizophila]|nr:hypothetical protein BT69DRAFT_1286948 [Atractiella rhizophila]